MSLPHNSRFCLCSLFLLFLQVTLWKQFLGKELLGLLWVWVLWGCAFTQSQESWERKLWGWIRRIWVEIPKLWAERTFSSFDLSLLTVCLPSSSLLQRPFIAASNHISLLALFSQTLLPLCFFFCLFSCFCNPCLPLQHPTPGRTTAVFAATTAHHGQGYSPPCTNSSCEAGSRLVIR